MKVFIIFPTQLFEETIEILDNYDKIIIIECYRALDPTDLSKIWNDFWLKRYTIALFKRQWGENLIKFNNVQLPGGVQINGRQIYEDALKEIEDIEMKMISDYELGVKHIKAPEELAQILGLSFPSNLAKYPMLGASAISRIARRLGVE